MGQQETTDVSSIELGHDCLFGIDDLEGTHVYYQGTCVCACMHVWLVHVGDDDVN